MTCDVIFAFLHHGSFFHWLVYDDGIVSLIVNWFIGALLAMTVGMMVLRPLTLKLQRKIQKAWAAHEHQQAQLLDALDSKTPGGITDLIEAVEANNPNYPPNQQY